MKTFNTPVCIVGAGPAGTTASLFLSKYGVHHILADRETFPRDKVCGEQFSGRVGHVIRELNPDWETELFNKQIICPSRDFYLYRQPENKKTVFEFNKNKVPTLKAKRSEFDAFLFEKAINSQFVRCFQNE